MNSKEHSAVLDLEGGLRLTAEDVEAMRCSRRASPMSPAEYLRFLSRFALSPAALRERRGPRGERFSL